MTALPKTMFVAALCAGTLLGGCGDDKKGGDASTGSTPAPFADTPTPKAESPADKSGATATQKWAKAVCAKLVTSTQALQPPTVEGTSPEATKASLTTFFTQLSTQLGNQSKALTEVGPPPGPNGAREYARAARQLERVQKRIDAVIASVKSADVTSAKDVQALTKDLSKSLDVMSGYDGPIAQLMKTKSVGKQLAAEPGCASLGLTGQTSTS